MNKLPAIVLMFLSLGSYPQIPPDFPAVDENDPSGAKILLTRHFTGESLFGYMDGGAELYREYGISDAVITELDLNGTFLKCEIFKMNGPEEAFGIYSVSRYRCQGSPPLSTFTCQNNYQLQICKGEYYIHIINRTGNEADQAASRSIGEILAGKITGPSFEFSEYVTNDDNPDIKHIAVLVRGKLGLANGAPDWEDYFKDITGYSTLIIPSEGKSVLSVRFKNPEDFRQFMNLHGWGTCDLSVNGLRMHGGEIIKLLADTHLLVEIVNK